MRFSTLLVMPALLPMFGAEAMLAPAPDAAIWHHEGITKAAAHEAGLSKGAGANLAFQADAIDQYLHSPFWLLAGGLRRVRAIRRRRSAWETLHFDDLADGEAVAAEWERISGGAVCGVVWAATSALPREVRLRAAEHVIGLGMHAIQDFYSHSTWIDEPERRALTWQDERARARRQEGEFPDVLTGSYLHETPSGGAVHGGSCAADCWAAVALIPRASSSMARSQMASSPTSSSPTAQQSLCLGGGTFRGRWWRWPRGSTLIRVGRLRQGSGYEGSISARIRRSRPPTTWPFDRLRNG